MAPGRDGPGRKDLFNVPAFRRQNRAQRNAGALHWDVKVGCKLCDRSTFADNLVGGIQGAWDIFDDTARESVSYTHLTLPTKRIV